MFHVVTTQSGNLNVRSGPGTQFRVVASVTRGTVVDVAETRGGWHRLVRPAGWVSGQYLQPHGGGTTTQGEYEVSTQSGRLNVRGGPGTNHPIIGTLRNGARVLVVGQSGDWRRISSGGFVHSVYLTAVGKRLRPLPDGARMWQHYPADDAETVKRNIGGRVDAAWIKNTCVIRLSHALNKSGHPVPASHPGLHVLTGDNGAHYAFRVTEMRKYMEQTFGPPTIRAAGPDARKAVAGKRGIILFVVDGWGDATGHFDMWNRRGPKYSEFFAKAKEVLLWAY